MTLLGCLTQHYGPKMKDKGEAMAESKSASEHGVAVQELIDYISDLSEEAYCAAWMDAVECALWRRVTDGPGRYGQLDGVQLFLGNG